MMRTTKRLIALMLAVYTVTACSSTPEEKMTLRVLVAGKKNLVWEI